MSEHQSHSGRGDAARGNGRDGGRGGGNRGGRPNAGRAGGRGGAPRGGAGGRGGQRQGRPRISGARIVAYDVLRDVVERDAYANLALASRIRDARLDGRDAALATELAAGTLRSLGRLDRIIELAADRSAADIDARTLNVLRIGAHQLLAMRTAAHAAVHESVELQRLVGNERAAGFVNGVLREIGRSTNEEWDARIAETAKNADDALALRTSHPAWVVRALRDALRAEGSEAELDALLDADNASPRVNLALLEGAGITAEELALVEPDTLDAVGPSPIGLELTGGDPGRAIAGAEERAAIPAGLLRVQDQGSQLAALALVRATPVAEGERWLDLCAGPGGKTAILGAEAVVEGATVRANEVSDHRAELVRNSVDGVLAVAPDTVTVVSHDGREEEAFGCGREGHELYDRILVDAPCSGLGALRRRPEARWRKQPSDLPELTALQSELIDAAVAHLKPGGVLAYVTCSPHLAETRVGVERALKRHPELRELDAKAAVRAAAREDTQPELPGDQLSAQLWPHRHDTDAMFVSLLTREAR
ncbi:transcription antitermination factor NusB [Leucobacter aridicollis]|uniref:transcription antitermination factor NusB n=1 Tax=Leucobacter aridicollis TaxID=283878 RepID=UPI002169C5F1|nr:transcription antitermination factor NusB [Leucobacter aridicollis]MCS3428559.1 16S rRNA (cytosine967-C5)-methyltransferase [Leucobacter aridicollis]